MGGSGHCRFHAEFISVGPSALVRAEMASQSLFPGIVISLVDLSGEEDQPQGPDETGTKGLAESHTYFHLDLVTMTTCREWTELD